jgi:hypothetical protein
MWAEIGGCYRIWDFVLGSLHLYVALYNATYDTDQIDCRMEAKRRTKRSKPHGQYCGDNSNQHSVSALKPPGKPALESNAMS